MKVVFLSLFTSLFLLACGPNANFNSDSTHHKSLMDGETVEVVANGELDPLSDDGDGGLTIGRDDIATTPEELTENVEVNAAVACGDKDHKVLVCHYPNGEFGKRKTLCIGRPALEAHLKHLGAKRGSEHVDKAGQCPKDSEETAPSEIEAS